ncbi:hypothetical protein CCHR01_09685 [Colletotrichum chrysophilum]|uniref:Uncharacterized protein n=1 Tax=Colletotrichum chrysophilum TaxID=1836956 RepID=A0AAD9AG92_9PEZI|nr:hypothetical protein CCHR01_09685 [Colletotrichum chrysophilum]
MTEEASSDEYRSGSGVSHIGSTKGGDAGLDYPPPVGGNRKGSSGTVRGISSLLYPPDFWPRADPTIRTPIVRWDPPARCRRP